MPRTRGRRALQGRSGRGGPRATTSAADDPEPESSELSSGPTSDAEEGAGAAPPQASRPQTSVAGGHGGRGWSTYRFAHSRMLDVSQAKMELALALETIDRYDDSSLPARAPRLTSENRLVWLGTCIFGSLEPTDGQPIWSFICENWPYGYHDRAINGIFHRALTLNVQTDTSKAGKKNKANYCLIETTIRRLGFRFKDLYHVMLTFKVAFLVMLAVELRCSGFGTISRDYKHASVSQAQIHDVLRTNPVIRAWMHPPASFFNDLCEVTSHGRAYGFSDVAVEFAKQLSPDARDIPKKTAEILYLRQIAKERHTAFVEIAIDAVMQQFWQKAGSTWLSRSKQVVATTKSQWEDLHTRCAKEHLRLVDGNDVQHEKGFWLPRFEVGMASAPERLVDVGKEYGASLNECRMQLQEAAEAMKARKAALEAEADQRKQDMTSKRKDNGKGKGRARPKRFKIKVPEPEEGEEEFYDPNSSSSDEDDDESAEE